MGGNSGGGRQTEPLVETTEGARGIEEPDGAVGTRRSLRSRVRSPVEPVDCRATVEKRELGAMVELLGLQAEAESWILSLEAETRGPPAVTPMETGRSTASPLHRWGAE
ncbi:hypothetical protein M9458_006812, partial [Cirrhinus mrigala]